MLYIIKTIGLIMVVVGVLFAVMPSLMLKVIEYVKIGKRIYPAAVVRIILGGLLLWASPVANIMWIPLAVGGLMLLTGVLPFLIGLAKAQAFLDWWAARTDQTRRLLAIIAACLGAMLVYGA